jgi:hypothetical protein
MWQFGNVQSAAKQKKAGAGRRNAQSVGHPKISLKNQNPNRPIL